MIDPDIMLWKLKVDNMTKREDQLKERIHDLEEMLVQAAIMAHDAREERDKFKADMIDLLVRAEGAERNVKELEQQLDNAEKQIAMLTRMTLEAKP